MKPMFSYKEIEEDGTFNIYRHKIAIGWFNSTTNSERFVKWLVDLLNEHHEDFSRKHSEKSLREMGF